MPIDPATGMWVDDTSLVDPATGSPLGDIAPAVPAQPSVLDGGGLDVTTAPPQVALDADPNANVNLATGAVTPVKQTVTEKVKGKPGETQEVVRETTTTPVTSGGTKVSAGVSRTGYDADQAANIDRKAAEGVYDPKAMTASVQQVSSDYQDAITEESGYAQQYAKDDAIAGAELDRTVAGIRDLQRQELERFQTDIETIKANAKTEIKTRQAQWDVEKQELARLIAINPTSELYTSAGGAVGLGMIMTQAMGSYLTAMGVQNNLGEQMNQWVDRAQQYVTQRINGQKQALDATGDAITRVWENATSETAARAKIAEVGLAALDARIEVEKLKTSSKMKLASLNLVQAQVRTAMEKKRQEAVTTEMRDVTHIATSDAQRKASLAAAYQASTSAKIALAKWDQEQKDRLAALQTTLPPNILEQFTEDGKIRLMQVPTGFSDAERKGYRVAGAAMMQTANAARELKALMATNKAQYGTMDRLLQATTPEGAKARELMFTVMVGRKVVESGTAASERETQNYMSRLGAASGSWDAFKDAVMQVGGKADPKAFTEAFLDTTVKSAHTTYTATIPGVQADPSNPAVAAAQQQYNAAAAGNDYVTPRNIVVMGGATPTDVTNIVSGAKRAVALLGNARGDTAAIANDLYGSAKRLTATYTALASKLKEVPDGSAAHTEIKNEMTRLQAAGAELQGHIMQAGVSLTDRRQELLSFQSDPTSTSPRDSVGYNFRPGAQQQVVESKLSVIQPAEQRVGQATAMLNWATPPKATSGD